MKKYCKCKNPIVARYMGSKEAIVCVKCGNHIREDKIDWEAKYYKAKKEVKLLRETINYVIKKLKGKN